MNLYPKISEYHQKYYVLVARGLNFTKQTIQHAGRTTNPTRLVPVPQIFKYHQKILCVVFFSREGDPGGEFVIFSSLISDETFCVFGLIKGQAGLATWHQQRGVVNSYLAVYRGASASVGPLALGWTWSAA
jgi:hypothetical protein